MKDCIFCKLTRGELPTNKIYEDEQTFAFLDKHPINPGHILVVPKSHVPDFYDLENSVYQALMVTVKRLAKNVNDKMDPRKVGLIVAGWDVPHTHVHIVPMNDYHDITSKSILEGNRSNPTNEELSQVAELLKTR